MKSFLMPFLVFILIFTSCSQESSIDPDENKEFIPNKRDIGDCVEDAICDIDYKFPFEDPLIGYNCFTVTFAATTTEADIFCIRQAYFKCFPLRMGLLQPTNPHMESWCLRSERPGNTISETIGSDPRVDDGG